MFAFCQNETRSRLTSQTYLRISVRVYGWLKAVYLFFFFLFTWLELLRRLSLSKKTLRLLSGRELLPDNDKRPMVMAVNLSIQVSGSRLISKIR